MHSGYPDHVTRLPGFHPGCDARVQVKGDNLSGVMATATRKCGKEFTEVARAWVTNYDVDEVMAKEELLKKTRRLIEEQDKRWTEYERQQLALPIWQRDGRFNINRVSKRYGGSPPS